MSSISEIQKELYQKLIEVTERKQIKFPYLDKTVKLLTSNDLPDFMIALGLIDDLRLDAISLHSIFYTFYGKPFDNIVGNAFFYLTKSKIKIKIYYSIPPYINEYYGKIADISSNWIKI